ncbi:MAG: N-acetylmuramoyl-L-alanine amidase, partial [Gemmatimonadaceae bacterium]
AALIGPAAYASDTERVVTAYMPAGGIQRWFLLPGTVVKVVGTRGNDAFVRLDTTQTIRIDKNDLALAEATERAPKRITASAFELRPSDGWTEISIPVTSEPAFLVEEGLSSMTLTLYATNGPARRQPTANGAANSYVRSVTAIAAGPQMRYIIGLGGPIYGYQPLYENGRFSFRVRRPPAIDSAAPLRGLTIAVDPGHPPIGATGPTGLWEPVPTLAVGLRLRELLQAKGATVVMTRDSPEPVDLNLRSTIARRANAHALVSLHLNAVPDGVNPFRAQGTATYHYHLHSGPMAKAIQAAAVVQLGLPNNGVKRENFALVRGPWMPAVLVEGAFIIIPEQEAALQTPEYQERYARAIVDGLEAYFRSLPPDRR